MKRVSKLILCVGLGVALTLATAWIPPLFNPPLVSFPGLALPAGQSTPWIGAPHTAWIGEPAWLATEGHAGVGVRSSFGCVEAFSLVYTLDDPRWQYLLAAGWPFYAFHGGGHQYSPTVPTADLRAPPTLHLPAWVPSRQNHAPAIAIGPCWRGLMANIVFWSLAVAVPLHLVAALRRSFRQSAGRCVHCGYPTRGLSGVCPECGHGVAVTNS